MPAATDLAEEVTGATTAMASHVTVRVPVGGDKDRSAARAAVDDALEVFHAVDRTCTRFVDTSDLVRANAAADEWCRVARWCLDALAAAEAAYRRTDGRFDPRVHDDLVRLGYDRSFTRGGPSERGAGVLRRRAPMPPWRPGFDRAGSRVRVGPQPVDLGGIGKGLAVRWAADRLRGVGIGHLVTAGGDCVARGAAPDGGMWRVAVEDPHGGSRPVAVLGVTDAAVATSSVRIRSWNVAGTPVHHLVDPATGLPGGDGLSAVTVVGTDPADSEVWSKCLFLAGARGIATMSAHHAVAALWVAVDGTVGTSAAMRPWLLWERR